MLYNLISTAKTWMLVVEDGKVVDCDDPKLIGKTLEEVELYAKVKNYKIEKGE
jgi:hypothetical protein